MEASREGGGRPTQFHGVPIEDRAFDSQGNRLPWALEWADDHPNARFQKRQTEEKGAFGKSLRRRGTPARSTRTQTPAKRENPTLDGFEAALKFDAQQQQHTGGPNSQPAADQASQPPQQTAQEPTPAMLYGYAPDTQYAAIGFYENVSGGMILEDYDRRPPNDTWRFGLSVLGATPKRRALTRAEQHAAAQYAGGACWVKVTFDSRAAADRAIASSPHALHGHWVHAAPYTGHRPIVDAPIPVTEDSAPQNSLDAPHPPVRPATLGAAATSSHTRANSRPSTSLPRGYRPPSVHTVSTGESAYMPPPPPRNQMPRGYRPPSVHTVSTGDSADTLSPGYQAPFSPSSSDTLDSNATLQGPPPPGTPADAPELRSPLSPPAVSSPLPTGANGDTSTSNADHEGLRQRNFSHFPDTPMTQLKDASEALLPSPSWMERVLSTLTQSGLIPGDVIGSTVPRLENGDFDWGKSSFYWRLCYWLDTHLGTDLCGMREG